MEEEYENIGQAQVPEQPTEQELSFDEQEARHQDKLSELARNSPFFVNCDEELFELNDDGSVRVHKQEKQEPEVPAANDTGLDFGDEKDTYTYLDDEEDF
jgi:hypothetical protein